MQRTLITIGIAILAAGLLWGERSVVSVANLTRADGRDFMRLAAQLPLQPSIETVPLTAANDALARLRSGKLEGAAVLVPKNGDRSIFRRK